MSVRQDIRNVAIIAHVDHGKTTLVDALLTSGGAFRRGEENRERAMDRMDLEKERGITITSKPTALEYNGVRINIVDTPGHADFGGEVERVLNMVDAVLVVIDAFDGPMPQTRFVTKKAIERGLKVLCVVNKIDREGASPHKSVDGVFDLLIDLGASDEQQDFPVMFCSARERYAMADPDAEKGPISLILDMIIEHVPPPKVELDAPPALWVTTLDYDPYLGFVAIGRLDSGTIKTGDRLAVIRPPEDGPADVEKNCTEIFRVAKLLRFSGLNRGEVESVSAGDIVCLSGMEGLMVGDTMTTEVAEKRRAFPKIKVDPPTLSVRFRVNDGPFCGKDGKWVTTRKIAERLQREIRSNVALHVENTDSTDEYEVHGRGELHLTVLMETMRREGYEFCVSRPKVILRRNEEGQVEEPYEEVSVECETEYTGAVIEELGRRLGELHGMEEAGHGRTRMQFKIPSRGLIGYRSEFLTATRGTGIMASVFAGYGKFNGPRKTRQNGVLVVLEMGETTTYSLHRIEERGELFVGAQAQVYGGQIIGQNARREDMIVNPNTAKKLTNVRAAGADEKLFLTPPRIMSLEDSLAFIEEDELIEVTPLSLRLRKRFLDHNLRKRMEKAAESGN
jgi:GTP-binding protein